MSSIDLVILGIVLEKPQSAYDIQKDVEYHHFSTLDKNKRTFYLSQGSPVERKGLFA